MNSLSFVLLLAGLGMLILLLLHILMDVFKLYGGFPFVAIGMNSILIYAAHEVFMGYFPFYYESETYDHWYAMCRSTIGTVMWIIIAQYFKHIKFFVKI